MRFMSNKLVILFESQWDWFKSILRLFWHRDNFKSNTCANTDGIVKCLLQPGRISNQLHKSMLSTSIYLLNFLHLDSSCCRDKVSRAAGRRAVGSVFCSPFIKCTVTSNLRTYYRDSYVIGCAVTRQLSSTYRDWQKTRQPWHRRHLIKPPSR